MASITRSDRTILINGQPIVLGQNMEVTFAPRTGNARVGFTSDAYVKGLDKAGQSAQTIARMNGIVKLAQALMSQGVELGTQMQVRNSYKNRQGGFTPSEHLWLNFDSAEATAPKAGAQSLVQRVLARRRS